MAKTTKKQAKRTAKKMGTADKETPKRGSLARRIVDYVLDPKSNAQLFVAEDGTPCITVPIDTRRETMPIESKAFGSWLMRTALDGMDSILSSAPKRDIIDLLSAKARHSTNVQPVFMRTGSIGDDCFIDLGDPTWHAVKVSADRWEIVDNPPIKFRRSGGSQPLPRPSLPGQLDDLELLRAHLNLDLESDSNWLVVLAWVTHAYLSKGPYAVLCITGQAGTAKSTATRMIRAVLDPHTVQIRGLPRPQ